MTALQHPITPEYRQQLEELYRQQISAVRTLARLLGYSCPIASRQERRIVACQSVDSNVILDTDAVWSKGSSSGS